MNCLRGEYITSLEDFSNEIIYEIFEYIDYYHTYETFYNLNQRFKNLFIYSNIPIKIDISFISKSTFERYLKDIIIPQSSRIKTIKISHPFSSEICMLLFPIMTEFIRLERLILNNIECNCITQLVDYLPLLPVLSSLTIFSDYIDDPNDIYKKIFYLPTLKYCSVSLGTYRRLLFNNINRFSSIEHLVINQRISFDQMDNLLSHVPQLHCLSIKYLYGYNNNRTKRNIVIFNCLTNVYFETVSVKFNDFESIVKDYFHQVKVLHVSIRYESYETNLEYLNSDRWEKLIISSIPNLCVFDFKYIHDVSLHTMIERENYEIKIDKFNSRFWREHQWFFEHQQCSQSNARIFYSKNPYHRKNFEDQIRNLWSSSSDINNDPINHIYLHNQDTMKQLIGHCSNANQLTLQETFESPYHSLITNLQLILPLKQLTKLTLNCQSFSFEQLVELFQFTINVHTLKIPSIFLKQTDSISIQKSERFQIVSKTNRLIEISIDKTIRLEQIQLIINLFPRLEYLTMDLYKQDLKTISQYLWSKSTHHLCLLCIPHEREDLLQELTFCIESDKLLQNYSVKVYQKNLYLWW